MLSFRISCQVLSSIGRKLYLKEESADVHFVFDSNDGECIRVPAHKFLMTEASVVFRTMFSGSWQESDEVKIVDASADGFKVFTSEQQNLKRVCETVICVKTKKVLSSDSFLRCDFDVLSHIVSLKSLACSEYDLFEACMERIETLGQDNKSFEAAAKRGTRKLMKAFRFGSISSNDLATRRRNADFFSYDEIVQMASLVDLPRNLLNRNRLDYIPHKKQKKVC